MYARKKKNRNGIISIQVIDKSSGNYKVLRTIGSSKDPNTVEKFWNLGKEYVQTYQGQQTLNFPEQDFKEVVKSSIKSINIEGVTLVRRGLFSYWF